MTVAVPSANRAPHPSSLADVLDKSIVIDAYMRLARVGIEILTLDARVVIASVDTYLRFAEAVNRLDIQPQKQAAGLPGLVKELLDGGGDEDDERKPAPRSRRNSGSLRRPARGSR